MATRSSKQRFILFSTVSLSIGLGLLFTLVSSASMSSHHVLAAPQQPKPTPAPKQPVPPAPSTAAPATTTLTIPAQPPTTKEKENEATAADDVISLETSLVVVNATVTDGSDQFVGRLKREDFSLLEDQQPQKIVSFSFEESPFAAAILLDASGSMENKMTLARAACASFVEGLREGDVFAIYTFTGTKVKQVQPFGEVRDVTDRLWDVRADGQTPLYDALVKAAEDLSERSEKRRAIILVSDGGDSTSRASLDDVYRKTSQADITIYSVDLSDRAVYKVTPRDNGSEIMKTMSAKTGGRFFAVPAGRELKDAFVQAVEELRHQYTLAFEPTNEKKDGKWRALEVHLNRADALAYRVRARQGYYAPKAKK